MAKKNCSSCGRFAHSHGKEKKCSICVKRKIICQCCSKELWIISIGNCCDKCTTNRNVMKHLENLELSFLPKSQYNRYIFILYLKYLRRFQLNYCLYKQAINFKSILESRELSTFTSWDCIYKESNLFKITFGKIANSGCPFVKTGRMLEELGVLNFRQRYFEHYINRINQLPEQQQKQCEPFIIFLRTTKRSQTTLATIVEVLIIFNQWINEQSRTDLLTVTSSDIQQFLDETKSKKLSASRLRQFFHYLSLFYRWSLTNKKIIYNPCAGIRVGKPEPRLLICSEEQCKLIFKFIQNKNTDSEAALILTLLLIWALTSEELRYAKIEFKNTLVITFFRHNRNTKKYYNREQTLSLPDHPKWFHDLQIRFYKYWIECYSKLRKSVPHHYLMLPRRRCIQPLTRTTLCNRVTSATKTAVGTKIPPNVLRKTSGFLHSQQGDASILATLGWDSNYCFRYTWVPKIVYQEKETSVNLSDNDFSKVR